MSNIFQNPWLNTPISPCIPVWQVRVATWAVPVFSQLQKRIRRGEIQKMQKPGLAGRIAALPKQAAGLSLHNSAVFLKIVSSGVVKLYQKTIFSEKERICAGIMK